MYFSVVFCFTVIRLLVVRRSVSQQFSGHIAHRIAQQQFTVANTGSAHYRLQPQNHRRHSVRGGRVQIHGPRTHRRRRHHIHVLAGYSDQVSVFLYTFYSRVYSLVVFFLVFLEREREREKKLYDIIISRAVLKTIRRARVLFSLIRIQYARSHYTLRDYTV